MRTGQKEYASNLYEILWLGAGDDGENPWDGLYREYKEQFSSERKEQADAEHSDVPWLKEDLINKWVEKIQKARAANERQIESMVKSPRQAGPRGGGVGVCRRFRLLVDRAVRGGRFQLRDDPAAARAQTGDQVHVSLGA